MRLALVELDRQFQAFGLPGGHAWRSIATEALINSTRELDSDLPGARARSTFRQRRPFTAQPIEEVSRRLLEGGMNIGGPESRVGVDGLTISHDVSVGDALESLGIALSQIGGLFALFAVAAQGGGFLPRLADSASSGLELSAIARGYLAVVEAAADADSFDVKSKS
ncbi:hypothetical protein [Aquabacterium sp.]|uniref:hypothetical protein n=1 Tax=Aquabacterium sp. TaxID=1872578 RepID=UPI0037845727